MLSSLDVRMIYRGFVRRAEIVESQVANLYPEYAQSMREGAQYESRIERTYSAAAVLVAFWVSVLGCSLSCLLWLATRRTALRDSYFVLPATILAFCTISIVVHTVMSGPYTGHYAVKIMFAPILVTCLATSAIAWAPIAERIRIMRSGFSAALDEREQKDDGPS